MNKTITWSGIAAAAALIAANGAKVIEVALGVWLFLLKLTETAPLGLASFALALALGVASRPFLLRYLPATPCRTSRDFIVDASALVIGLGVMFVQLRTLNGALLGLLAGFAAPLVARAIGALLGLTRSAP